MTTDRELMAIALVGGTAALTATLFSLAALSEVGGAKNWLWRWAPLVLLLAALAPIGAYELVALYGIQAAVVIGVISLERYLRKRRVARGVCAAETANGPTQYWSQFLLLDLLKAILLIAAVFAIVRYAAPSSAALIGPIDWRIWIGAGTGLGVVTVAAAWTVWSRRRWFVRVLIFMIVTFGVAGVLEGLQVTTGVFRYATYNTHSSLK